MSNSVRGVLAALEQADHRLADLDLIYYERQAWRSPDLSVCRPAAGAGPI